MKLTIEIKEPRNNISIFADRFTSQGTQFEQQTAFCDLTEKEQNKVIDTLELASIKLRQLQNL